MKTRQENRGESDMLSRWPIKPMNSSLYLQKAQLHWIFKIDLIPHQNFLLESRNTILHVENIFPNYSQQFSRNNYPHGNKSLS